MLPEWLPNIHPLIIHFPIVLLLFYPFIEALRLRFNDSIALKKGALWILSIGVLSLIFSFLSGEQAIESVQLTGGAVPVATEHELWARNTLIFYSIWFTVHLFGIWNHISLLSNALTALFMGLIGVGLLVMTSELGGRLVYEYGVGTRQVDKLTEQVDELQKRLNVFLNNAAPIVSENGAWNWSVSPGAAEVILDTFTIIGEGFSSISESSDGNSHWVILESNGQAAGIIIDGQLSNLEGEARLNTDNFSGKVEVIHNYMDIGNYQFFRIQNGSVTQGSMSDAIETIFQQESGSDSSGWVTLRVTSNNAHYYGYINNKNITHAHGTPLPAGATGLLIEGNGVVRIQQIEFKAL
jgi:uncharacterized membrane protein